QGVLRSQHWALPLRCVRADALRDRESMREDRWGWKCRLTFDLIVAGHKQRRTLSHWPARRALTGVTVPRAVARRINALWTSRAERALNTRVRGPEGRAPARAQW